MSYLNTIPFYVYKIELESTGQFYFGSRYNHVRHNRTPDQDLWIYYFSSSKLVKQLIDLHSRDAFKATIIYQNAIAEDVYWYEQQLIKNNIQNELCINKHYLEGKTHANKWCTVGVCRWVNGDDVIWSSLCPGPGWTKQGHPHSQDARNKISQTHKGKPKSLEHRRKLSVYNTGRTTQPHSEATKLHLSQKNKGLQWWNNGEEHVFVHSCPGEGWTRGALPKFTQEGMARHKSNRAGRIYWHNGIEQKMDKESPGPGWVRGRLYYRGQRLATAPTVEDISAALGQQD